jgi:hypothetical protein
MTEVPLKRGFRGIETLVYKQSLIFPIAMKHPLTTHAPILTFIQFGQTLSELML